MDAKAYKSLSPALDVALAHCKVPSFKFFDFREFVYDVEWRMDWKIRYGNTPHPEGLDFSAPVPSPLGVL